MNAIEITTAWNALTPEKQISFCKACVCKAIKSGRTLKPGYDMDDACQETYCKVLTRLANVNKLESDCRRRESSGTPDTLTAVVCRAANSTMECIAYHSTKDSKATGQTIAFEDGNEIDILDTIAAADNVEGSAILRAMLQQFIGSLDEINQKIIAGKIDGLTERELASTVGISNVAVHKRIVKMQKALTEML